MIRAARTEDVPSQQAVEVAAGARFREVGMDDVASDEPMGVDVLADYVAGGRSWVATDDSGRVVEYVVVDVVDGGGHIEQVSVDPEHQGRGLGRALIAQVEDWAREGGLRALTLMTFDNVPWNRPLYEHLGFQVMRPEDLTPGLQALRQEEANRGLDPADRVCMKKPVPPLAGRLPRFRWDRREP